MQSNQEAAEPGEPINSYALVCYIPGALGEFLDEMRINLVPSCVAQSHVTVLPPRSLVISASEANLELERELVDFAPFRIELKGVEVFASTNVIYVAIGSGAPELLQMHERLNRKGLEFNEFYSYHPHVTLAQEFPPQELEEMLLVAREQWARFQHDRSFLVESLTFVQNTLNNRWLDLRNFPLGEPVPAGGR
jgi:2'-5' RNA ligase